LASQFGPDGVFIAAVMQLLIETGRRCWKPLQSAALPTEAFGAPDKDMVMRLSCC